MTKTKGNFHYLCYACNQAVKSSSCIRIKRRRTGFSSITARQLLPPLHRSQPHQPHNKYDAKSNRNILRGLSQLIPILMQHIDPSNQALALQGCIIHAIAVLPTPIHPISKLIHHQAGKNIPLVINVREHLSIERIERRKRHHEAITAHPDPIRHRCQCQRCDEVREQAGHHDNQAFSPDKIEIHPHNPDQESLAIWSEICHPVDKSGRNESNDKQIR